MLACLGLQSTGGRRRLVQVTGVHDTLEGAITHCAGRAVHLACGGGGWGWVSGRPGRRQAGLTAGGHGMPGCVEEADVGACGSSTATELCVYDFVSVRFDAKTRSKTCWTRIRQKEGHICQIPTLFHPLRASHRLQAPRGTRIRLFLSALTTHSSFFQLENRSGFVALAAPHVRTLQGVDELSPNRPARLRLAKVFSTET